MGTGDRRVSFLVDPSMFQETHALPKAVYGDLDQVVRTDLHYHYSSPVCAQRWLDVCEDPAYGHRDLLKHVCEVFPKLLRRLREDCEPESAVSLISLGPGDGAMDLCLLKDLDSQMDLRSYCGLDFSFELLRRAVHRLVTNDGFKRGFPIQAVCGDFTDLGSYVADGADHQEVRLFSLTGFTLGNYQERDLLTQIGSLMGRNDYLFLDARFHGLGPNPQEESMAKLAEASALGSYDLPSVRRFVFGPLEVATYATASDVDIRLEVTQSLTTVPDAVNIVIYCTGLDTRMRLTGERIRRKRLNLAVTTMYHLQNLERWLETAGFDLVGSEHNSGMAFFLLKRRQG